MKWIFISLLTWTFTLRAAHAEEVGKTVTPKQVLALIQSHGASETIVLLDDSGAWSSSVLPGVAAARPDWLGVAKALQPGADAGGSEELEDALSEALLKAPYRVLPLLQEIWWKDDGELPCRFGWDSEFSEGVEQYVSHLKKALQAPPPAKLVSLREACLRGIEATLIEVKEHEAHPDDQ